MTEQPSSLGPYQGICSGTWSMSLLPDLTAGIETIWREVALQIALSYALRAL